MTSSVLPFIWLTKQEDPLILEAMPLPHHRYLLIQHEGLWAMSKMTGVHYKAGSTLSPCPETMDAALMRAHEDWAKGSDITIG